MIQVFCRLRICLFILLFAICSLAYAEKKNNPSPQISAPVTPFEFFGDIRMLPAPHVWKPGDPIKEVPRRTSPGHVSPATEPRPVSLDPLLEKQNHAALVPDGFSTPTRNFNGGGFSGVNPPDTVGDVSPNHYIQMINGGGGTQVRIYDKQEPVPNLVANFILDNLGSGVCASGFGDPIALYDAQADRWLLSEFAASGNNLCVYISMTNDPINGGWFNYAFTTPVFPDYPKYSVWPTDANNGQGSYFVVTNEGSPIVYALNRGSMLAGVASTFQRFTNIPPLSGFPFQGILAPADVDGALPPPDGSAVPILHHRDTEVHGPPGNPSQDFLEVWELDVDWTTPANSTLTNTVDVSVQELDSDLCGLSAFACFPQPGTGVTLDPLREPVMNRLQYINFGSHQTLVGDFVTDVDGNDHGGMRWFELRGGAGSWSLFQEGLYSIDQHHRWIGGIAMDSSGNIALGYSVSSTTVHPDIRYTGRLASDPAGTMSQPETVIIDGTASNASNRWGDYANMSLDPSDNCTFWYTSMYNVSSQWSTRVASMKFDACGFAGSVTLGQDTYSCSGTLGIRVTDANLIGAGSQDVNVSSTTETTPETVTLNENPADSGVFTGTIPLTSAPPAGDGSLSVAHADTITVVYIDADDGQGNTDVPRTDTATADCQGPSISNVQATNIAGTFAKITWNTNEDSDSEVVYDTVTPPSANTVSDTDSVTAHDLQITGLTSCTTYFYFVKSIDAAGNETVDNNSGAYFSFTTTGESSITYNSTNVPRPINDLATATSVINIPNADTIVDLNVQLNITHSWDGDLDIKLTSPNATQVELSTDNGGNGNNFTNTIFDDEAATSITSGAPPFTGSFRPEGSLSAVDGDSSSGTWTLSIFDDFNGDTGVLNSWSITVTRPEVCSGCPTITISPATLPDGAVSIAYDQTVTASGGSGPYTYAVISGSLPPGLALDENSGAISGTPTTEGAFPFTITATDSDDCTGLQSYTIIINAAPACLLCDDFEDGTIDPNWTYVKQTWTEDGDALIGSPAGKKAEVIATPIFSGCSVCEVQTIMQSSGGAFNKVWLLAWRLDKNNVVELLMREESDKFVLRQRLNGAIVSKGKAQVTIDPNTSYKARIDFDGTDFELFIDDVSVLTLSAAGTPNGTVGFRVRNTTARFDEIVVNQ